MEQDINVLINKSLDWLLVNLENFTLPSENQVEKEIICLQRKAFGELCVCCRLMYRNPSIRKSKILKTIIDYIEDIGNSPDFSFDMMRRTDLFPLYLITLVALEACDRKSPRLRYAIQVILDFGFVDTVGKELWSQIDLKSYLDSGHFKSRYPDYESLYVPSSAYHLPPIPYLSILEVYDMVHIIFNMADFGRRDIKSIIGDKYELTCEYFNLLLGTYTYKKDWDLVAEILICCSSLHYYPLPLYQLAWMALFKAQTSLGDIPSRYYNPDNSELFQAYPTKYSRFKINYHTTLVVLMAATLETEKHILQIE